YSVERSQALPPLLSTGEADRANELLPLGILIFAPSTMKAGDEAQATSWAFSSLNFQVSSFLPWGRELGWVTSSAERMTTVLSLSFAFSSRFTCSGVYTSPGLRSSPPITTIWLAGAV